MTAAGGLAAGALARLLRVAPLRAASLRAAVLATGLCVCLIGFAAGGLPGRFWTLPRDAPGFAWAAPERLVASRVLRALSLVETG